MTRVLQRFEGRYTGLPRHKRRAMARPVMNGPTGGPGDSRRCKPIERITIGDAVWAWDAAANTLVARPVTRVFRRMAERALALALVAEGADRPYAVVATSDHPFWVRNKGWVAAQHLAPGDELQGFGALPIRVAGVRQVRPPLPVFNFEVKGCHNYFVGDPGVLVHNESELNTGEAQPAAAKPARSGPRKAMRRMARATATFGLLYLASHAVRASTDDPFYQVTGRPLTELERLRYAPYFDTSTLEAARVYVGRTPFWLDGEMEGVTLGHDIYLKEGSYDPLETSGIRLLGHELAHVQQFNSGMSYLGYLWELRHGYEHNRYETEAYGMGRKIVEEHLRPREER
jgi:hypothetical protein